MTVSGLRTSAEPRSRALWLSNLLIVGALALLVGYGLAFVVHVLRTVPYPFPLDYGEGAVLNGAWRLARGLPIYLPYESMPAVGANYPPVFFALQALLVKLLGVSLTWGRSISLLSALAVGVVIWRAYPQATPRDRSIGVLFWLALGPVYAWAAIDKGDMLAIALSLWGVLLAARRQPIASGLLLGLAIMTKQTTLTALAATVLFLLLQRRPTEWRQAAIATAVAIGAVGFVSVLAIVGLGSAYLDHVLLANVQAVSIQQAVVALIILARDYWPLLALAAAATVIAARRHRPTVWHVYWPLALAALAVTGGKTGAYTNYYLELLAVSTLLLPWLLRQLETDHGRLVGTTAILVQAVLLLHVPYLREYVPTPDAALLASHRTVAERLLAAPGPLLAENAAWNVLVGEEAPVDDLFLFTQLAMAGRWDPVPLTESLKRRKFGRILLEFDPADPAAAQFHRDRFPADSLDAVLANYAGSRTGEYWLFVPR